jgi:hypothetical protein
VTVACDKISTIIFASFSYLALREYGFILYFQTTSKVGFVSVDIETVILDPIPKDNRRFRGKGKKQPPQTNPPTHPQPYWQNPRNLEKSLIVSCNFWGENLTHRQTRQIKDSSHDEIRCVSKTPVLRNDESVLSIGPRAMEILWRDGEMFSFEKAFHVSNQPEEFTIRTFYQFM